MSTTTAPTAVTSLAEQRKERRITMRTFFESQKVELSKLLPRGMELDRLIRIALTECVKNPELLECTAESWALAMQLCAGWGLYPDSGLGYVYLIPRKNNKLGPNVKEVQCLRGYQGDILLARNSGEIADIYAEVVYAKDEYRVVKGLERNVVHVPSEAEDPGELKAVYAVAKLKSGETAWVALTKRDVERHRQASESKGSDYSPWNKHPAAMWKKSAIRELVKWLPRQTEKAEQAARAIESDGAARRDDAIDIGAISIPTEPAGTSMDRLAEKLDAGAAAGAQQQQDCPHPGLPAGLIDNMPAGEERTCTDCGTVISGPGKNVKAKDSKKSGDQSLLKE